MNPIVTSLKRFNTVQVIPIVSILLGALTCIRYIWFINIPLPILTLLSTAILLMSLRNPMKVCVPLVAFVAIYTLFLLIHPLPEFKLRMARFIAFVFGLAMFSPLFTNNRLTIARKHIAMTAIAVLTLMVIVSFAIWLYCIITNKELSDHSYYYYGFKGIFDKGMSLSPSAALIAIFALHKSINVNSLKPFLLYLTLTLISVITCIAAGSRIAVAGMGIAFFILLINSGNRIKTNFKRPCFLSAVAFCGILLMFMLPQAMKVINFKNQVGENHSSLIYSRQSLWSTRAEEIISSPWIGIGYANEFHRENSKNQPGKLTYIEPGSGWLSLLSYGGVIGLSVFSWFLATMSLKIKKSATVDPIKISVIIPLMSFFFIDSVAEGWLMFAGSLMFPLFWLTCHYAYVLPTKQSSFE